MYKQLLTTLTSQYRKSTRDAALHQDSPRAIHIIIIAIRRAVVG